VEYNSITIVSSRRNVVEVSCNIVYLTRSSTCRDGILLLLGLASQEAPLHTVKARCAVLVLTQTRMSRIWGCGLRAHGQTSTCAHPFLSVTHQSIRIYLYYKTEGNELVALKHSRLCITSSGQYLRQQQTSLTHKEVNLVLCHK
jgi:hypothetical protein